MNKSTIINSEGQALLFSAWEELRDVPGLPQMWGGILTIPRRVVLHVGVTNLEDYLPTLFPSQQFIPTMEMIGEEDMYRDCYVVKCRGIGDPPRGWYQLAEGQEYPRVTAVLPENIHG